MPARRRGRGGRAPRAASGTRRGQAGRGRGPSRCDSLARGAAAALLGPRRRSTSVARRLSGPLRPAARRERGRAAPRRRLQPARSRSHDTLVGDRGRFRAGLFTAPRALGRRPPGAAARRPRRRRHRARTPTSSPSSASCRASACEVCLVGAEDRLFHAGLASRRAVPRPLRRQADPAARAGDDPRGCAARARARVARRSAPGSSTALLDDRPPNVEWIEWIDVRRAARRVLQRAGCALGIFGTSDEGGARDPEQGVPGARLRSAARSPPTRRRRASCCATARARCSFRPATRLRWRRRCGGSRRIGARRDAEPRRAGRLPRAGERRGARRALARRCSKSSRVRPGQALLWTATAAYAAGFGALSILQSPRVQHGPLRPREHGAGGLGDGARPPAARSRTSRASRSRGWARTSTRSSPRSRRCGGSGRARRCCSRRRRWRSRSARCPCSGSRASTSAPSTPALGFALAYLLYPAVQWLTLNEFHPVALALPAAALRLLVPRRGSARGVRDLRRARRADEGGESRS